MSNDQPGTAVLALDLNVEETRAELAIPEPEPTTELQTRAAAQVDQLVTVDPAARPETLVPMTLLWHKPAGLPMPEALHLTDDLVRRWFTPASRSPSDRSRVRPLIHRPVVGRPVIVLHIRLQKHIREHILHIHPPLQPSYVGRIREIDAPHPILVVQPAPIVAIPGHFPAHPLPRIGAHFFLHNFNSRSFYIQPVFLSRKRKFGKIQFVSFLIFSIFFPFGMSQISLRIFPHILVHIILD